ncbi:MAG: ribonuclease III [Candidatus Nanopelagicus sp.]
MFSDLTEQLGISVKEELLELALTHRSFSYEAGGIPTNERLEFLGDSVLGLIVTEELYKKFPDLDESRLSPLRSGVVNMKALAQIAREIKLGTHLRIGKGEESTNGRDKNSILADSLEALVGAIYLQHGYEKTAEIILNWMKPSLDSVLTLGAALDAKTALQELAASMNLASPEYEISESGPDHDKSFIATALVGSERFPTGLGKSKREAEQSAAKFAHENLSSRLNKK